MRFSRLFLSVVFFSILFFSSNVVLASSTDGTIDAVNKIAKGMTPNVGKINFGPLMGNVHVTDTSLTGYAWGENVGWINLAPTNGGVLNDAEGHLSGYAWGERIGWINFKPTFTGVSPVVIGSDGIFSGYAWGQNIGWISFNCSNDSSCGTFEYKVQTDWRASSTRNVIDPGHCTSNCNPSTCSLSTLPAGKIACAGDGNQNGSWTDVGTAGSCNTSPCQYYSEPVVPSTCTLETLPLGKIACGGDGNQEGSWTDVGNADSCSASPCQYYAAPIILPPSTCSFESLPVGKIACVGDGGQEGSWIEVDSASSCSVDPCQYYAASSINPPTICSLSSLPQGKTACAGDGDQTGSWSDVGTASNCGSEPCQYYSENSSSTSTPSECDGLINSVRCGWKEDITETAKAISSTTAVIKEILKDPEVNAGTKALGVVGIVTASASVVTGGVLFANPLTFGELFLIPFRLWALILSLLGLKKRYRPWGTVYDSVTKQPLDPAYVILKNEEGKEVASSITDLDGRYGFIVPKGVYYLDAAKTHYTFPSKKMFGQNRDDLYTDLYLGEKIEVEEDGAVIYKNIPMDSEVFDWNEFEKKRSGVMRFHAKNERFWKHVSNWVFRIGFVVASVALFAAPEPYNYIITGFYILILIMRFFGFRPKINGSIVERVNGLPLSFAVISVYSIDLGRELFKKVADKYGRYYILVPKGEYTIKISRKNTDETYTEVYSNNFNAKEGVINSQIKV